MRYFGWGWLQELPRIFNTAERYLSITSEKECEK
jgi:hypothetical protein